MTRVTTATATLALIAGLLAFDLATAELNPYQAPPVLALGSGAAAGGAHCAALLE
ncbi:MAG: hypothetical protein AAFM92_00335 [Pseudomonadota bacterium]